MTGVQETFTAEKIEELRKKLISLRIDLANLAWLQSKGEGDQKN